MPSMRHAQTLSWRQWLHICHSYCTKLFSLSAVTPTCSLENLLCSLKKDRVCRCSALVDARGLHCFVCKRVPGHTSRHHAFNDMVAWTIASTGVPAVKEPNGLTRVDGKRPDGLTLIPWNTSKSLTWDVKVKNTLATSYVDATSQ